MCPNTPSTWLSASPAPDRADLLGRGRRGPGRAVRRASLPSPDAVWGSYPHFVASVDCAALPRGFLDIPLPEDGHLLFFANKHDADGGGEPDTRNYVVHVPAGTATVERAPEAVFGDDEEFEDEEEAAYWTAPHTDPRPLYARPIRSLPADDDDALHDPEVRRVYRKYGLDHHDKRKLVWEVDLLLGGYAYSPQDPPIMQSPVERVEEEWVLLAQAQYAMHADPDCQGCPFWIIRRSDLEKGDFAGARVAMWNYY
ncbi:YwqG family protein [Nocardiopsis sp. ARC36]